MGHFLKMTQLSQSEKGKDQFDALLFWVSLSSKMKGTPNSCEMRCTSLASRIVSVQNSAKDAVNLASSTHASF